MTYEAGLRRAATDLKISVLFSTRLPFARSFAVTGADIARASWALPLAGALIGLLGAIAYWLAHAVGLPPLPAGALALATTLVATGCLHEDGLADTADGFGGGTTRERKLEIMRDSRIGAFGAVGLILFLMLEIVALAELVPPARGSALFAAPVMSRATPAVLAALFRAARPDGHGAAFQAGVRPAAIAIGLVIAVAASIFALGGLGVAAGAVGLVAAVGLAFFLAGRLDGVTGDVLGAAVEISELAVLLTVSAWTYPRV